MKRNRNTGFTLVELMIVLAIVAVMATIAVPYIGDFVKNGRIKSSMHEVIDTLNMARTEAVKNKMTVSLCRSNNQSSCTGSANDWSDGWLIFIDENGNGSYDSDSDTILRTGNPASGTVEILATANSITYRPDGTVTGVTRMAICDDRGEDWGRFINVLLVGRASVQQGRPGTPISDCSPS